MKKLILFFMVFIILSGAVFAQDNGYKKNLLYNTHPNLYLSNVWEKIRLWVLDQGIKDDPTSQYTRFFVPEEKRAELEELIKDFEPVESKTDPNFLKNKVEFW